MNGIRKSSAMLAIGLVGSLAACVPDPYSQSNGHTTNTQPVNYAPAAPPAPIVEVAPPAPGPTVSWQPGHWAWTGTQWSWVSGEYEQPPTQAGIWQPGHWERNSNGYYWVDGSWQ